MVVICEVHMKYQIVGGKKLEGNIRVSGNKNSIFPCVSAALLTEDEVVLENISNIRDVEVLVEILKKLGVLVEKIGSTLYIRAKDIKTVNLPQSLMTKLRGSIVLVGAILARKGRVNFYHPGGDIIGQRSIGVHLGGLKKLGATLKKNDLKFSLQFVERVASAIIFLKESSVTATENLILSCVLGSQKVILKNCPVEPHILDLCSMLLKMGAKIEGVGTHTLVIKGVEKLFGTRFKIGIDFIEVGTYGIAAAITGGKVTIKGLDDTELDPIFEPLSHFGIEIGSKEDTITIFSDKLKADSKITTNVWPGFPTDLMSAVIVLATQSKGITLCHDWMYESRMFFVDKLISMGAKITLADPHRALVYGPTKLKGRVLETPDIRAGMALVLAGLVARGKSVINQAELIERGYEDVVEKLRSLGADIERVEV